MVFAENMEMNEKGKIKNQISLQLEKLQKAQKVRTRLDVWNSRLYRGNGVRESLR